MVGAVRAAPQLPTLSALREMSPARLWTELHLHKGYLGEGGASSCYYLGMDKDVGCVTSKWHMVLPIKQFPELERELEKRLRQEKQGAPLPLQGPVFCTGTVSNSYVEARRKISSACRDYLNGKPLVLKRRGQPQPPRVDPEDAPDVGRDVSLPKKRFTYRLKGGAA